MNDCPDDGGSISKTSVTSITFQGATSHTTAMFIRVAVRTRNLTKTKGELVLQKYVMEDSKQAYQSFVCVRIPEIRIGPPSSWCFHIPCCIVGTVIWKGVLFCNLGTTLLIESPVHNIPQHRRQMANKFHSRYKDLPPSAPAFEPPRSTWLFVKHTHSVTRLLANKSTLAVRLLGP